MAKRDKAWWAKLKDEWHNAWFWYAIMRWHTPGLYEAALKRAREAESDAKD